MNNLNSLFSKEKIPFSLKALDSLGFKQKGIKEEIIVSS